MSFSWHGRTRQVRVTAVAPDRQVLQTWENLDLTVGQQIPIPPGTCMIWVEDPAVVTHTRVDLSQPRRERTV